MPPRADSDSSSTLSGGDEILAELIEGLLRQARRGESPDVEAVIRAHPELASDLRELWATVQIAENLAELSRESLSGDAGESTPSPVSSRQPRVPQQTIGDYDILDE